MSTQHIHITEIGPRDGLQGEALFMRTEMKSELVHVLADAGLTEIEVTAFVHPAWIPNMADAETVITTTEGLSAKRYALVPNAKGLSRALSSTIEGITTVFSATDGHNLKNLNRTTAESLAEVIAVGKQVQAANRSLRASISTVFGCPFDAPPTDAHMMNLVGALYEGGYRRIGLCDTIGVANPAQVKRMTALAVRTFPDVLFDLHFHNTYGRGLANVVAALDAGITSFDSSIGGLGGCPYAPGATGNISTEDLVAMLHAMGLQTAMNQDALFEASALITAWREQPIESQCWRVHQSKQLSRSTS